MAKLSYFLLCPSIAVTEGGGSTLKSWHNYEYDYSHQQIESAYHRRVPPMGFGTNYAEIYRDK